MLTHFLYFFQTEIEKKRIALETIHRHDRFISTRLSWTYVCPGSWKYSKPRRRKSRRRKSVKSCYSTNPLIPYFSSYAFWFFVLMALHHRGVMEYCGLYFLTHAFLMVQIFNSKHNDSFRFHWLQRLIIWLSRLMVTWVRFTLFVYFTIAKIRLKRRIQLVYYRTRHLWRPLILFCLTVCQELMLSSVSVPATQRPAVNVMSRCFYWMKPHFVVEETPVYSGCFLSPDIRTTISYKVCMMKYL